MRRLLLAAAAGALDALPADGARKALPAGWKLADNAVGKAAINAGRQGPGGHPPRSHQASYDDWMHGLSARFSPRPIPPRKHVLSIWKGELDETRDWRALVTTVLHPQCSGRPIRLRLLREFLTYAKSCPDLWIATGQQIAANFIKHEAVAR